MSSSSEEATPPSNAMLCHAELLEWMERHALTTSCAHEVWARKGYYVASMRMIASELENGRDGIVISKFECGYLGTVDKSRSRGG